VDPAAKLRLARLCVAPQSGYRTRLPAATGTAMAGAGGTFHFMPELDLIEQGGHPPESAHARQLRRGFPGLRFEPALEADFRRAYRAGLRPQVRRNLWLAILFVAGFSWLTHGALDPQVNRTMDLIRLCMFGPIVAVGLFVVHSRFYDRFYSLTCQIAAPLFGITVAVLSVLAAQQGVSLISSVVTVTFYVYLMLGLMFYEALASGCLILLGYVGAALWAGLAPIEIRMDAGIVVLSNVIGAMVCYSLERAHRTNFLESQLLIETASRDGLTGIHNRRAFDEHLGTLWPQAARERMPLALLLIDIDHFKAYNDFYGHQAGDECLKQVAWCLNACARRPLDLAARYGGEEFAIVLYDVRYDHVHALAQNIQDRIEALRIEHLGSPLKQLTVSIGAACIEPGGDRSHFGFIQLADEALYEAKERGRNCAVILDKQDYDQLSTGAFRARDKRLVG
jgi:diguanylate cyclase (GGDEF)-like protein